MKLIFCFCLLKCLFYWIEMCYLLMFLMTCTGYSGIRFPDSLGVLCIAKLCVFLFPKGLFSSEYICKKDVKAIWKKLNAISQYRTVIETAKASGCHWNILWSGVCLDFYLNLLVSWFSQLLLLVCWTILEHMLIPFFWSTALRKAWRFLIWETL